MSNISRRTFSLPLEQAEFIDSKVSSGSYASASEVVRAGLRALQERDAVVDRWLMREVAPVYDAMMQDRRRAIPVAKVFAKLKSQRRRATKRGPKV